MIELIMCACFIFSVMGTSLITMSLCQLLLVVCFIYLMEGWEKMFNYFSYVDSLNSFLVFLTVLLLLYCFWLKPKDDLILTLMMSMCLINTVFFMTPDSMWFFILFELSLLPFFFMILFRAQEPERLSGILFMALYTLTASMPFLLMLILLIQSNFSFFIFYFKLHPFSTSLFFLLTWLPFLVKLPIYGVHRWLPIAHVYSPVVGSVILAGVMLKVGAYGLHMMSQMMYFSQDFLPWLVCSFALWGGSLAALSGVTQSDMKSVVAYSSITHMSVICFLILSADKMSISSLICICVSHGLVSPMLFRLVEVLSNKSGSRNMNYNMGMKEKMIFISLLLFIVLSLNLGVPPSMNFLGEAAVFMVVYHFAPSFLLSLLFLFILSGIYSAWLWCTINSNLNLTPTQPVLADHMDYYILFINFFLLFLASILFAKTILLSAYIFFPSFYFNNFTFF